MWQARTNATGLSGDMQQRCMILRATSTVQPVSLCTCGRAAVHRAHGVVGVIAEAHTHAGGPAGDEASPSRLAPTINACVRKAQTFGHGYVGSRKWCAARKCSAGITCLAASIWSGLDRTVLLHTAALEQTLLAVKAGVFQGGIPLLVIAPAAAGMAAHGDDGQRLVIFFHDACKHRGGCQV